MNIKTFFKKLQDNLFPHNYNYNHNSTSIAGEDIKTKKVWCGAVLTVDSFVRHEHMRSFRVAKDEEGKSYMYEVCIENNVMRREEVTLLRSV